ncbi:MAG: hypothetical protein KDB07_03690 [Planctomycetes bacterium]|nr:hypothetical protein [Planctomycetota bacterium]
MNRLFILGALCLFAASLPAAESGDVGKDSPSRISDERKELVPSEVPDRPPPLIEIGDPFLDTGEVSEGFRGPTGAIWRPRLLVFGDFRASHGFWGRNRVDSSETILDLPLFANLYLTATERILFGINPLGRDAKFTGRRYQPFDDSFEQFNAEVDTLFFEGDLPELFPSAESLRGTMLDLGFSVGRQLVGPEFNDGFLINDRLDAFGLVRKSSPTGSLSHYRVAAIAAWADLHRGGNRQLDESGQLFGLLTSYDFHIRGGGLNFSTTIDLDLVYVNAPEDTGDGFYAAVSAAQRFSTGLGKLNTTFRFAASIAAENETAAVRDGSLFFFESSLTPHGSKNILYFNGYIAEGEFSSAARDPRFGGVLGPVGVAFADIGLGAFPSALSSNPANSVGGALGWQIFNEDKRRNLVLELAARAPNDEVNEGTLAVVTRFQQAFWTRIVWRVDGYGALPHGDSARWGVRSELQVKF